MENYKKTTVKYPFLQKPVVVYERENGHKIVCAYKEGGLANISTWVKTGSINENDKDNGISHFLEHLMFKGTLRCKAGEFDKTLESKGAIINAATWKDYTFYYVTIPSGENNEDFNLALDLHADMMLGPVIPDEEVGLPFDLNDSKIQTKRERHVVIEEIRMREDQPWTKVYNILNENMYKQHPYKRDVIGNAEIISSIPRDTIMNYYSQHYTPDRMTTVIVGDFDFDKIITDVINHFDFKGRKNSSQERYEIDAPVSSTKYIENYSNINTGFVMFGYLGTPASDLKETSILEMISIILGEGISSRLYQNLIQKRDDSVFNIVSCDYYSFRDGGNLFVQANFDAAKKEQALELLKEEIKNIYENKISQQEFNKALKKLKARFASSAETVSEIAETIGYYMTVCNGLELVDTYIDTLESITIDDVQKIAQKYLNLDNAVISVLMPQN